MSAIEQEFKICKNCTKELPTSEFYKQVQVGPSGQRWEYYDTFCKPCRIDYGSIRRRELKIKAVEYKGNVCEDCGIKGPPVIYDFHHLDPSLKDFSISNKQSSWDKIVSELDKCILLCSNCHRIRHFNEGVD